ncbi:unnamed protein product [Allacma fusca]|uniref:Guanine nucleotide exchange factor MSS4 n=1 Tax=Allacma fusca TaxID=39272 RepID=A0A8J2JRF6_9HEXA|nr:unnamed protein product [Allacma fusca]
MEKKLSSFTNSEDVVQDGKNKVAIYCVHCTSLILNPATGTYLSNIQFDLPTMTQKKNALTVQTDPVTECFRVDDMYHFENIGFSVQANDVQYLACADCEFGPVGWCKDKISFIALSRVRYEL